MSISLEFQKEMSLEIIYKGAKNQSLLKLIQKRKIQIKVHVYKNQFTIHSSYQNIFR